MEVERRPTYMLLECCFVILCLFYLCAVVNSPRGVQPVLSRAVEKKAQRNAKNAKTKINSTV